MGSESFNSHQVSPARHSLSYEVTKYVTMSGIGKPLIVFVLLLDVLQLLFQMTQVFLWGAASARYLRLNCLL